MAKLVGAFGVPHAPYFPQQVTQSPGKLREEVLFKEVREQLEAAAPDLIIGVVSDHLINFYHNNLPQFCVSAAEEAEGPSETYCVMQHHVVPGHPTFAKGLLTHSLKSSFDLAVAEEVHLDHSMMVPLHFLTPSMDIPVVPLYVNGLVPPLPSARRCYALGQSIARFIEDWPGNQRVALVASGAFSLEVGGPNVGWTDEPWVSTVSSLLQEGEYRKLTRRATEERMIAAGNVGGELLCWITVTGAMGETRPLFIQTHQGIGFGAWNL